MSLLFKIGDIAIAMLLLWDTVKQYCEIQKKNKDEIFTIYKISGGQKCDPTSVNYALLIAMTSHPSLLSPSGVQVSDQDSEDLRGRLQQAETRMEELAESLKRTSSSMEQYRAMAQSLEESLNKEKQASEVYCDDETVPTHHITLPIVNHKYSYRVTLRRIQVIDLGMEY